MEQGLSARMAQLQRENIQCKARAGAMKQLQQIMARMVKGELGMRVLVWRTEIKEQKAMAADAVAAMALKSGAMKQLQQIMARMVKGELGTRVLVWRTEIKEQKAMAASDASSASKVEKAMAAAVAVTMAGKSSAMKQLQQIMTRMVKGELGMRVLVWRLRVPATNLRRILQPTAASCATADWLNFEPPSTANNIQIAEWFRERPPCVHALSDLFPWAQQQQPTSPTSLTSPDTSHSPRGRPEDVQKLQAELERAVWKMIELQAELSTADSAILQLAKSGGNTDLIEEYENALLEKASLIKGLEDQAHEQNAKIESLEVEVGALQESTQEVSAEYSEQVEGLLERVALLTSGADGAALLSKAKAVQSAGRHKGHREEAQELALRISMWRGRMRGTEASVQNLTVRLLRSIFVWKAAMVHDCFLRISELVPVLRGQLEASEQDTAQVDQQQSLEQRKIDEQSTQANSIVEKPEGAIAPESVQSGEVAELQEKVKALEAQLAEEFVAVEVGQSAEGEQSKNDTEAYTKLEAENKYLKEQLEKMNDKLAANILDVAIEGALKMQAAEVAQAQRLLDAGQNQLKAERAHLQSQLQSSKVEVVAAESESPGQAASSGAAGDTLMTSWFKKQPARSARDVEIGRWFRGQPEESVSDAEVTSWLTGEASGAAEDEVNVAWFRQQPVGGATDIEIAEWFRHRPTNLALNSGQSSPNSPVLYPFEAARSRLAQARSSSRSNSPIVDDNRRKAKAERIRLELEALRNMG